MSIELVNSSSKVSHITINNNLNKLNNIESLNRYRKILVNLNKNIDGFNVSNSFYIKTLKTVEEKLNKLTYESDYIKKELTEFKKLLNLSDVSNQNLNKSFNYRKKLNNYKNISKITDINNLKSKFNKKIVKKIEDNITNLDNLIKIIVKTYDILIKLSDNNKPEQDKIEFIKKLKDDLEKLKNIKPNSAELSKNQNLDLLLFINKLKKSIIAKINEKITVTKENDIDKILKIINDIINRPLTWSNYGSNLWQTMSLKRAVGNTRESIIMKKNYSKLFDLLKTLIEDNFDFFKDQNIMVIDNIIKSQKDKIITLIPELELEMKELIELYNNKKESRKK